MPRVATRTAQKQKPGDQGARYASREGESVYFALLLAPTNFPPDYPNSRPRPQRFNLTAEERRDGGENAAHLDPYFPPCPGGPIATNGP